MRKHLIKTGLGLILATIYCVLFTVGAPSAEAATTPLSGYAWSETIGWISFKGANYGVLADTSSGVMSGYAWSEHLGWLSFNQSDLTGCPSGTCRANLNVQGGTVTGWAKFLSTGEWVHLSGSGYGVSYNKNSGEFSGYAWSDTNAGWIKWKHTSPAYGVITEDPIVAPPEAPSALTATAISKTQINLAWTDNASGETGFKIERKTGSTGTYAEIATVNPNTESYSNTGLSGGTLYYYRVKATNNGGVSEYSNEASTTTLPHTAAISVDVQPNTGSWTINPGDIERTGDTSITVNPSGQGTLYSITPGDSPSGYDDAECSEDVTWDTGSGGSSGCSMTLFGDEDASFTVTYPRSFDYSLSSSGTMNVQKGGGSYVAHGQVTIEKELASDSGPAQPVDLSVSGLPTGVSLYSISGNPAAPDSSSVVDLAVSASASAGTYDITVTGTPLGKTTIFELVITNSPGIFVSCTATGTRQVGQTITWRANVDQDPEIPPYNYYWTGTNIPTGPAPSTQSFEIVYSTTGQKTANVLVTDDHGNTGVCNPQGTINIGVTPIFEEF